MKKAVSLLIIPALLACSAYAQSTFEEKKIVIQGGFGYSALGFFGNAKGIPLSFSVDYGVSKELSAGVYAGIHSSRDVLVEAIPGWLEESGIDYGYTSIAVRALYHVNFFGSKNIDTYGVVSLGYCIVSASMFGEVSGLLAKESFLLYGVGGGIRYFFTPNIGVFGEAGYGAGIDLLGFGLSFKF
jgi:hypothetical protein